MATPYQKDIAAGLLAGLTPRQREVLDLVIQHHTYKEIARTLSISPHTVEQRVRSAKAKLGVQRRSDLATAYRELRETCVETVYDESRIVADSAALPKQLPPVRAATTKNSASHDLPVSLVPAIFEGPDGTLVRVGVIFAIAAAVMVVGLGGLSMLEQLSRLLS